MSRTLHKTKATILIVEDEAAIRAMLDYALTQQGLHCVAAAAVEEAKRIIEATPPDLILLDWMLPGMSGIDYARRLRSTSATQDIPIIMLTAKGEEADKVIALDAGADDYVTKPFSTKELIARVNAVLRRYADANEAGVINVNGLVLDPYTYRVTVDDQVIGMTATEFKLLHFFITHPERVYSRSQILDQVWGEHIYVEERTVDVHIRRLRKKLESESFNFDKFIRTVRSVGYFFSTR